MINTKRCRGIKKDESNCNKRTKNECGYCYIHAYQHNKFKEKKPEECQICLEKFEKDDKALECGHWIHLDCIQKTMKPECPVCRTFLNLPKKILKCIEKNAKDAQKEWEEEDVEELRNNIDPRFFSYLIMSLGFDVMRTDCICENCPSMNNEELIIIYSEDP